MRTRDTALTQTPFQAGRYPDPNGAIDFSKTMRSFGSAFLALGLQ
jgi:hypothetical protein